MNSIRQIQELNKREAENGISPDASWHVDYRDTAYIYIGGLPFELSEGDIITIFSQFGEPTFVDLIRDKETGKSRGFAFLKYEDQRSTDLAVDNLGGAVVLGRTLRVDHTRYKKKDEEPADEIEPIHVDGEASPSKKRRVEESETEDLRPTLKEERELAVLIRDHDEDDPMKEFLIQEKRDEVARARQKLEHSSRHSRKSHRKSRPRDEEESDHDRSSRKDRHRHRRRSRSREESRRSGARESHDRKSTRDSPKGRDARRDRSPHRSRRDRDTEHTSRSER